jgi:hypothetical protein
MTETNGMKAANPVARVARSLAADSRVEANRVLAKRPMTGAVRNVRAAAARVVGLAKVLVPKGEFSETRPKTHAIVGGDAFPRVCVSRESQFIEHGIGI